MTDILKGKVAVVTGSGRGIGKSIAEAMASDGARVVINDINSENAELVTQNIRNSGGQALAFTGDISNFEVAKTLIQAAIDVFGRIDILVNNAGINKLGMIWEILEEDWDRIVNIHLKGTFNCTRHACRFMKEQNWGRIINTTSIAWWGSRANTPYAAAKAGIIGLTCSVAKDMQRYGVTCNAYRPLARTELLPVQERDAWWKAALKEGDITEDQSKVLLEDLPSPDAIPPLLIYLCTEKAANITGQIFYTRGNEISVYKDPLMRNHLRKEKGFWTVDDLEKAIPKMMLE